jgi:hypothetical protein
MKPRMIATGLPVLALALALAGCATPDQRIAQLKRENQSLMNQNRDQEQQIATLKQDKEHLTTELNYYTARSQVLDKEKAERIRESQNLRRGIRSFTEEVMKIMRDNYKKMEIVDYIGGELIPRQTTGKEINQLLVDMLHPLPAGGTLIGGWAYVTGPTRLTFCLLRPSADRTELTVMDMSRELKTDQAGEQHLAFEVPIVAHKGDFIGIFCPDTVAVPYDDLDTGNVMMSKGGIKLNSDFSFKPAEGRNKRAYSFGVTGFLDKE